jgi:4-hydroxy-2-oxoheptanedioate aldolase
MSATRVNTVKARLRAGKSTVGVAVTMPSVALVQILAGAGFDWLFIDMEHGPIGLPDVHAMIAATGGTNAVPLVRVPWTVPWLVKPVLDAGAMGIVFPMVRTAEDAGRAVSSMRYPPQGERGWGPFYAPYRWGISTAEYTRRAAEELLTVVLIEHPEAIRNAATIAAVPGVDVAMLAPYDLSVNMGLNGPTDPAMGQAIGAAEDAVLASPASLGGPALSAEQGNAMLERGYRFLGVGYDALLIERAAADILGGLKL